MATVGGAGNGSSQVNWVIPRGSAVDQKEPMASEAVSASAPPPVKAVDPLDKERERVATLVVLALIKSHSINPPGNEAERIQREVRFMHTFRDKGERNLMDSVKTACFNAANYGKELCVSTADLQLFASFNGYSLEETGVENGDSRDEFSTTKRLFRLTERWTEKEKAEQDYTARLQSFYYSKLGGMIQKIQDSHRS